MSQIAVLNSRAHRNLRVRAQASAQLGDNQRFVPVAVTEFAHLVVHYPILFSKDADTGALYCGAMLGFAPGENLFLKDGGGHDGYRPLNLQRIPFYAAGTELAIDLDHPRVGETDGTALFDENGAPTAYLESVGAAFRQLKPGLEMTRVFIDTLLEYRLIEPIDINVSFDDGSKHALKDLYTVSQPLLQDLPDATVLEFFRRGYLRLMDLMIVSLKQIPLLAQRKNNRLLL